jgi:fatty-acyl-CoA synthase
MNRGHPVGAADYVAVHAGAQPEAAAARDLTTGRRWTYREFDRAASQFATLLAARGVVAGERVATLAKNRAELVLLHLACARLGAIYVPLNWRLSAAELAGLVADAEPRLLLGDESLARAQLNGINLEEFSAEARALDPLPPASPDPEAPSLILYTSGTSGRPKGVLLSERNVWQTGLNFSQLARITHTSVFLCDAPMFHVIGLVTNIRPVLMRGGSFVVSDGFVPARTLARLADPELKVTHYVCVPQMAAMLRADPCFEPGRLRGMTGILTGGAPHAAEAIRAWCRDGIPIADGFGMSEAGTVSCMPLDVDLIAARPGSAGLIAAALNVQIRAADGRECPVGTVGELFLRGAGLTSGYWRQPEATREAFDADGWFRTGDIAYLDDGGYLWPVDRQKDLFISGGENVYPAEIECALAGYAGIVECAVVGVRDEQWGEVGHLAIVPAANTTHDLDSILGWLDPLLARYKLPKYVSIVPALPRNGAGKVVKSVLKAMLTDSSRTAP